MTPTFSTFVPNPSNDPEAFSGDMADFEEARQPEPERCSECGTVLEAWMPSYYVGKGLCSSRCWAYAYGEID